MESKNGGPRLDVRDLALDGRTSLCAFAVVRPKRGDR